MVRPLSDEEFDSLPTSPPVGAALSDAEFDALPDAPQRPLSDAELDAIPDAPTSSWPAVAKDTALDLAQGGISLYQSGVGVADIGTFDKAGKVLDAVGYAPEAWKAKLAAMQSPALQEARGKVAEAKGVVDTAKAYWENPRAAVSDIAQSAPMSLGSAMAARAVAARLLAQAGLKVGTPAAAEFLAANMGKITAAGSVAEGAMTAGSIQEQARDEGREWWQSVLPALGGGALTAAIGYGTSKIPGLQDVEASLAAGTLGARGTAAGFAGRVGNVAKGMLKEGVLEEAPQSAQEQVATNLATGKPWADGVGKAAVSGAIAGAGMGGGMSAAGEVLAARNAPKAQPSPPPTPAPAPGEIVDPGATDAPAARPVAPAQGETDRDFLLRVGMSEEDLKNLTPEDMAATVESVMADEAPRVLAAAAAMPPARGEVNATPPQSEKFTYHGDSDFGTNVPGEGPVKSNLYEIIDGSERITGDNGLAVVDIRGDNGGVYRVYKEDLRPKPPQSPASQKYSVNSEYNKLVNEGGEGYQRGEKPSPPDATLDERIARLRRILNATPASDPTHERLSREMKSLQLEDMSERGWTKESLAARRKEWNDWALSFKAAGKKISPADIAAKEKALGWRLDHLKEALSFADDLREVRPDTEAKLSIRPTGQWRQRIRDEVTLVRSAREQGQANEDADYARKLGTQFRDEPFARAQELFRQRFPNAPKVVEDAWLEGMRGSKEPTRFGETRQPVPPVHTEGEEGPDNVPVREGQRGEPLRNLGQGAGRPVPPDARAHAGVRAPEIESAEREIRGLVNRSWGGRSTGSVRVVERPSSPQAAVASAVNTVLKRSVFFVDGLPFDGVKIGAKGIFISTNAVDPLLKVFGHEIAHTGNVLARGKYLLALQRAADQAKLAEYVEQINARYKRLKLDPLTPDAALEEFGADFIGDQLTDPAFFERLAKTDRGAFAKIARWVVEKLNALGIKTRSMDYYFTRPGALAEAVTAAQEYMEGMARAPGEARGGTEYSTEEEPAPEMSDEQDAAEMQRIRDINADRTTKPVAYRVYEYVDGVSNPRQYRGQYKTEEQAKARVKTLTDQGKRATWEEKWPEGYNPRLEEHVSYSVPEGRVTPAQDAEYLAAAERGDMETAQRMVERKFPKGEGRFKTKFRQGRFFSDNPLNPEWLAEQRNTVTAGYREIYVDPRELVGLPGLSGEENHAGIAEWSRKVIAEKVKEKDFDGAMIEVRPSGHAMIYEGNHRIRAAVAAGVPVVKIDVNYINGSERFPSTWHPITRDDEGNVIPLSERFDEEKDDIRYSVPKADTRRFEQLDRKKKAGALTPAEQQELDALPLVRNKEHDAWRVNLTTQLPGTEAVVREFVENDPMGEFAKSWRTRPQKNLIDRVEQRLRTDSAYVRDLAKRSPTGKVSDEVIAGLAFLQAQSAQDMATAKDQYRQDPSLLNQALVLAATGRYRGIHAQFYGAAAEAGRALAMMRNVRKALRQSNPLEAVKMAMEDRGITLSQDELTDLFTIPQGDTLKLVQWQANALRSRNQTWHDWLTSYRMFNLLFSVPTQTANLIGNAAKNLLIDPVVDTVEAIASKDKSLADVGRYYTKFIESAYRTSALSAWQTLTRGISDFEAQRGLYSGVAGEKLAGELVGKNKVTKALAKPLNLSTRITRAGDVLFRDAAYLAATEMLAFRQARQEGLTGAALESRIQSIIESGDLHSEALKIAEEKTFQEKSPTLRKLMQVLNDPMAKKAGSRWVVPFAVTPYNITTQGMRLIPGAGALISRAQGNTWAKATGEQAASLALAGLGYALSASLGGGDDSGEKEKREAQKIEPYTIRIGGMAIKYGRLGPLAFPVVAGAALREYEKRGGDATTDKALLQMLGNIGRMVSEYPMLQGTKAFSDAMREPENKLERFLAGLAQQLVPALSMQRTIRQSADDRVLAANDVIERMVTGLLGPERRAILKLFGRDDLVQDVSSLGQPKAYPGVKGWGAFFGWIKPAEQQDDPVITELIRLKIDFPGALTQRFTAQMNAEQLAKETAARGRAPVMGETKTGAKLTTPELVAKKTASGKPVYDQLKILVSSGSYQSMKRDEDKAARIYAIMKMRGHLSSAWQKGR